MAHTLHFAASMVACWLIAQVLARSTWTWRSPRVAILCWQAIGLGVGLSAMGLPIASGLAPYQRAPAAPCWRWSAIFGTAPCRPASVPCTWVWSASVSASGRCC